MRNILTLIPLQIIDNKLTQVCAFFNAHKQGKTRTRTNFKQPSISEMQLFQHSVLNI